MIVCAAGDTHGALDRLFADVLDFEASLGVRFDWVLHVGDFGAWPDPSRIDGATKRHYTRDEIDAMIAEGPVDILLVHDAPAGVRFERHRRGAGYVSEAAGLDELLRGTRPRVCFFGHHHSRFDATVDGVPCVGLNKVRMPGNLVAVDLEVGGPGWSIVGEWPPRRPA